MERTSGHLRKGPSPDPRKLEELLGRVVGDIGAAMSAALVSLGDRLGLYRALGAGPATSAELAGRSGVSERMVREWLLNQASGGYISYDASSNRYFLTTEQAMAFADENSPAFMVGAFDIIASAHRDQHKVAEAFKSGKGMAWGAHDACLFCGTERFFGANYRANLIQSWIPALEGIGARLRDGGHAADVGCGHGASTILMAAAFPASTFSGFDFHTPSIDCAMKRASQAGAKNARFAVAESSAFPEAPGGYDLVTCFDCLHDMGDPVACAKTVHKRLKPGGTWMVVEPAAGDRIEENLNPVGRVFSAASTMICVPASMAYGGPALGACAGPAKIIETIKAGGFNAVRVAVRTPFNLIFEARK
jgi:2-polyprenyl-3-methyl-5-hydroxy-6-metoxy-1,4-benzoquinol methylase